MSISPVEPNMQPGVFFACSNALLEEKNVAFSLLLLQKENPNITKLIFQGLNQEIESFLGLDFRAY